MEDPLLIASILETCVPFDPGVSLPLHLSLCKLLMMIRVLVKITKGLPIPSYHHVSWSVY